MTTPRTPLRFAGAALAALALAACDDRAGNVATEPPEGAADRGVLADGQTKMNDQRGEGPAPATGSGGDPGTAPSGSAAHLPGTVSSMGTTGAGTAPADGAGPPASPGTSGAGATSTGAAP